MSAVTSFFDALGTGCFAPTTAYLKFRGLMPDELIPATMMSGYALAAATEGFVFITSVQVDPLLLGLSIAASVLGALLGVSIAARLPLRPIRLAMGLGLLIAAATFALSNLGLMPHGGTATSLPTAAFTAVVTVSFVLGILMNLGIGNFAPTLILISLLGMDPRAAFPIMIGLSRPAHGDQQCEDRVHKARQSRPCSRNEPGRSSGRASRGPYRALATAGDPSLGRRRDRHLCRGADAQSRLLPQR